MFSQRDFLIWSETRQALFCFPCRLFKLATGGSSTLSLVTGWSSEIGGRSSMIKSLNINEVWLIGKIISNGLQLRWEC